MSTSPQSVIRPPTADELHAAIGAAIPDVIAPDLTVLFCGINPGLYSAAVGHHFARPGNRFWSALHCAGFTDRLLAPQQHRELIDFGYGVTSLVQRATARATELHVAELVTGRRRLACKARCFRPAWVAVLGVNAFRAAFGETKAMIGPQAGIRFPSRLWLLPSPSGANGSYPLRALIHELCVFRQAVEDLQP